MAVNELEQAYFLRVNQGLSYEDIGEVLFMAGETVRRNITDGFQRQSSAKIYKKAHEFCMLCNGEECKQCRLMEFIQFALIKKKL